MNGQRIRTRGSLFATAVIAATFLPAAARGAEPVALDFVTHASFFSQETKQPNALDPQVFVRDPAPEPGVGPQGIQHAKGLRPLLLGDPKETQVNTATGNALGFTAGKWLGATGHVTITPGEKGGAEIVATFEGLKPGGTYSLFENHFDTKPISFTPLDGKGERNSLHVSISVRLACASRAPAARASARDGGAHAGSSP